MIRVQSRRGMKLDGNRVRINRPVIRSRGRIRKRTRIIGLHARIGIALQRHFPGLVYFAIARALRKSGYNKTPTEG